MKNLGKFLLLSLVYLLTFFLAFLAVSAVFLLAMTTEFGYSFVDHLTGGMPDVGASLLACVCSFFACQALADRISAHGALQTLGILIILLHILFGIINFFSGNGIATNVIHIICGAMITSGAKK